MSRQDNPNQILIDSSSPTAAIHGEAATTCKDVGCARTPVAGPIATATLPLTQRLPWDLKTTFLDPTEAALEAGTISDDDNHPDAIKAIHEDFQLPIFLLCVI